MICQSLNKKGDGQLKNQFWGALSLSLAASIWGSLYVISKYVMDYVPPFTLLWLRYVIAGVVLSVLLLATRQYKVKRQDILLLVWIGFIGYFVSVGTQFVGTKLTDAHTGALITASSPVFTVLLAHFLLQESIDIRKMLALGLSMLGIVLVVGYGRSDTSSWSGSLVLLLTAITWAVFSIYVKKASARYTSLTITTYAILFAIVFTTPVAIWEIQSQSVNLFANPIVWLGTLYIGFISTALAFFLWNKGMDLMEAGAGSLFLCFQPIIGSLLGYLWLHEQLSLSVLIGAALIVAGLIIVSLPTGTHPNNRLKQG